MVSRLVIAAAVLAVATTAGAGVLDAAAGRGLFAHAWVLAPSSLHAQAGLGPLYDARACVSCHAAAGPGRVGEGRLDAGAVVRLGARGGEPDPVYGEQIQTRAAPGLAPEADILLGWRAQGAQRRTTVMLAALGYGPMAPATHLSLRRAPGLFGVGLLDQVPATEIIRQAEREHGDGVAGQPAWLVDGKGGGRLGRWGWKASQPGLDDQTAIALRRDMGVSSRLRPGRWGDCTAAQGACRRAAGAGAGPEASDAGRSAIVAYLRSLAAPAPAPSAAGEAVFARAGCSACHATLHTADGAPVRAYSDLLLHDMGAGLSDGVGEGAARPEQWRTAPLWNLRAELAAGGLLHDARARSIAEAVAWHGGEGARARARYARLTVQDRRALDQLLLGR